MSLSFTLCIVPASLMLRDNDMNPAVPGDYYTLKKKRGIVAR